MDSRMFSVMIEQTKVQPSDEAMEWNIKQWLVNKIEA